MASEHLIHSPANQSVRVAILDNFKTQLQPPYALLARSANSLALRDYLSVQIAPLEVINRILLRAFVFNAILVDLSRSQERLLAQFALPAHLLSYLVDRSARCVMLALFSLLKVDQPALLARLVYLPILPVRQSAASARQVRSLILPAPHFAFSAALVHSNLSPDLHLASNVILVNILLIQEALAA